MKRSDMLSKLHWYLTDQIYTENEDGTGDVSFEFTKDLLSWIEDDGMLPPIWKGMSLSRWVGSNPDIFEVFTWEDEDD